VKRRSHDVPAFLRTPEAAARWAEKNTNVDTDEFEYETSLYNNASEYSRFAREAYRRGTIPVWRMVQVPRGTMPNLHCLGRAWAYQPEGVGVYGTNPYAGRSDLEKVVMEGRVQARDVDWEYGFTSFIYYGEDQSEVSIHDHSPILIVKIGKDRFDPPLRGMSGTTPYDVWRPGCETPPKKMRTAWKRANL